MEDFGRAAAALGLRLSMEDIEKNFNRFDRSKDGESAGFPLHRDSAVMGWGCR
jgi:hypothetical protein